MTIVNDNMNEVIRKSAEEVTAGSNTEYLLRTKPNEGILAGVVYDYVALGIASEVETYTFKSGGSGGTTVAVIVVTYTDATRADISTVERTS